MVTTFAAAIFIGFGHDMGDGRRCALARPLALLQGLGTHTRTISLNGWLAVLFLGTLGGAVGFGLWSYALRRSTPSRVAVFLALNPISAIALGVFLLGEPITMRLILALVAVLAGINLATRMPVTSTER